MADVVMREPVAPAVEPFSDDEKDQADDMRCVSIDALPFDASSLRVPTPKRRLTSMLLLFY
jgi:hypothetical protein